MEPAVARGMVQGAPDTLHSEFHLSYTMLLNLLLGEAALGPEALLQASFRQFQTERALPALRARIAALEVRRALPAPLPKSSGTRAPDLAALCSCHLFLETVPTTGQTCGGCSRICCPYAHPTAVRAESDDLLLVIALWLSWPSAAQEERDSIGIEDEEAVEQYAALLEQQAAAREEMRAIVMQPRHALPFLQPGRLVRVRTPDLDAGTAGSGGEGAEGEHAVHGTAERVRLL